MSKCPNCCATEEERCPIGCAANTFPPDTSTMSPEWADEELNRHRAKVLREAANKLEELGRGGEYGYTLAADELRRMALKGAEKQDSWLLTTERVRWARDRWAEFDHLLNGEPNG